MRLNFKYSLFFTLEHYEKFTAFVFNTSFLDEDHIGDQTDISVWWDGNYLILFTGLVYMVLLYLSTKYFRLYIHLRKVYNCLW